MLVLGETWKLECPGNKIFRKTVENQQIQPTYGVGVRNRIQDILAKGIGARLTTIPTLITFALHFME